MPLSLSKQEVFSMPVVSSFDHSEHYKIAGSTLAYGNDKYFQLSDELKLNMIVDLAVPWYIFISSPGDMFVVTC